MQKNKTKTNLWVYLQDRMFETIINLEKRCSSSSGLADCIIPEQCFSKLPHLELRNTCTARDGDLGTGARALSSLSRCATMEPFRLPPDLLMQCMAKVGLENYKTILTNNGLCIVILGYIGYQRGLTAVYVLTEIQKFLRLASQLP